jgi:predicted DNA-binding protein (MmcQ/YjbR family)
MAVQDCIDSGGSLAMNIDQLRAVCLSFPGATEQIQWENDLLFKVAGKMFAATPLEPAPVWLTLKATPESFVELRERTGVIPAPYLARAKWIAIETPGALSAAEVATLLRSSYDLVVEKLPRKTRESLAVAKAAAAKKKRSGRAKKRVTQGGARKKRKA